MLTDKDIKQIEAHGTDHDTVQQQLNNFKKGFPPMEIIKPALVNDGIIKPDEKKTKEYQAFYEKNLEGKSIIKFVPASGAASRMFKNLYAFIDRFSDEDNLEKVLKEPDYQSVHKFIASLDKFAFYESLKKSFKESKQDINTLIKEKKFVTIISRVLNPEGLNYGASPKGLIEFHKYTDNTRTAIEEHLVEGAQYAQEADSTVKLHFTVSPEHMEEFKEKINEVKIKYEKEYKVNYDISFSIQKPSTDVIAVDMKNQPFRLDDGSILFRPGGHGALLSNLNEFNSDCIFIKNIDNVCVDRMKETTNIYKKVIAGVLFSYQEKIYRYLEQLEDENKVNEKLIDEISKFLKKEICTIFPESLYQLTRREKINFLRKKLNRPIRVAGMVKSEGDTGGGPFWAKNKDGSTSLQIVETAQIDLKNPRFLEVFNGSTHFSPADFALCVKDYKGNKFDLMKYRDSNTGFITKKSKDGRDLKAQELPGLWNGSMADWNTLFVEVPIETFNPVKNINDLLNDAHQ